MCGWKSCVALLIATGNGCTPDHPATGPIQRQEAHASRGSPSEEKQLPREAGSGKELYGDLTVLPVGNAAQLAEIKRQSWVQYLGRDDHCYYLFRYTPVANDRTHLYVYSVPKSTVIEGELMNGLGWPWPADYQPPALPNLNSWTEKNKIDTRPLRER